MTAKNTPTWLLVTLLVLAVAAFTIPMVVGVAGSARGCDAGDTPLTSAACFR